MLEDENWVPLYRQRSTGTTSCCHFWTGSIISRQVTWTTESRCVEDRRVALVTLKAQSLAGEASQTYRKKNIRNSNRTTKVPFQSSNLRHTAHCNIRRENNFSPPPFARPSQTQIRHLPSRTYPWQLELVHRPSTQKPFSQNNPRGPLSERLVSHTHLIPSVSKAKERTKVYTAFRTQTRSFAWIITRSPVLLFSLCGRKRRNGQKREVIPHHDCSLP